MVGGVGAGAGGVSVPAPAAADVAAAVRLIHRVQQNMYGVSVSNALHKKKSCYVD